MIWLAPVDFAGATSDHERTLAAMVDHRMMRRKRWRRQAERRGFELLQSWLTPEQWSQFRSRRAFEVFGCDTGTRYRITDSVGMMNVKQQSGRCVRRLCFMPRGGVVDGDVMLAQKVALETMERKALAVANTTGPPRRRCWAR
jgi:hypothetical protein